MAEIVQREFLRVNLVHRAARIRNCPDLVLICFFPPIEGCGNVTLHVNHPHELPVIGSGRRKPVHQIIVVIANDETISINDRAVNLRP